MASTTVVIPFALPPAPMAPDLIRALQAPSLAALLSRHSAHALHPFEADSRVLPHEAWLAHALGLNGAPAGGNERAGAGASFAAAAMAGLGMAPHAGHWFIVHPVSIQIGSQLQLNDRRGVQLDEAEARTLFDSVLPLFDGDGHELLYGDTQTWFMRADDWAGLATASPDAASGSNLHPWMPTGDALRPFRRLQNEVQMLWHTHPVNHAREARGLAPINSFWLWAGADAGRVPTGAIATAAVPDWLALLAPPERRAVTPSALADGDIAVVAPLVSAALAEDWSHWLGIMTQLETQWFAPLLAALRAGTLKQLTLVLTNRHQWTETRTSKMALRQFWRPHTLKHLTS